MKILYKQFSMLTIFTLVNSMSSFSQSILKELPPFNKIIVNPNISLTLQQGDTERIQIIAENIDLDDINIKVKRGTLSISLEDWYNDVKIEDGGIKHKQNRYENATVHANVSFKHLKTIVVRGEENIICSDRLENDIFKLRVYGEAKLFIQSIEAKKLKTKLYGESELVVQSGGLETYKSKLYGENVVCMMNLPGEKIKCTSFGENKFTCNSNKKLKVISFGEAEFIQYGDVKIRKALVLGENKYLYAQH